MSKNGTIFQASSVQVVILILRTSVAYELYSIKVASIVANSQVVQWRVAEDMLDLVTDYGWYLWCV